MYSLSFSVHENFETSLDKIIQQSSSRELQFKTGEIKKKDFLSLFQSQIESRHLDLQARELKERSQSYYTIGSSGHEGNVVFGHLFSKDHMAFLHYRSCAFFLQRAKEALYPHGVRDVLLSLMASTEDPIAGGRHKVLGSLPLNFPPQTSTIASHLPKSLGAALSLTRAKELKIESRLAYNSSILVSFGDASFNHASCQATLNTAEWIAMANYPLPLLFICEDNGVGISTPTPKAWIASQMKQRSHIHYIEASGLNLLELLRKVRLAKEIVLKKKRPVFFHFRCVRLLGHAGSDIETLYHSLKSIEETEKQDPLLMTARIALENHFLNKDEVLTLYHETGRRIEALTKKLQGSPLLRTKKEVMSPLFSSHLGLLKKQEVSQEVRKKFEEVTQSKRGKPRNMSQSLNLALGDLMADYKNIVLLGEDIGKKGGVYHVTTGLQKTFGGRRVIDTLLDETTILGSAIGLAHNGFLPIPEIQFLAYLHNAEDQIRGEASTLSFFSNGQFSNPMVLRLPSLAYQKGFGGHFHNDNSFAVLRDIPSLLMVCPSSPSCAAQLLRWAVRTAWERACVVVFLEPIALYMTKDLFEEGDGLWLSDYSKEAKELSFGDLRVSGDKEPYVVLSYGNGFYKSMQGKKILKEKYGVSIKVIDLRWLKPLPMGSLVDELENCKGLLIVDECRKTGSLSEELLARIYEEDVVQGKIRRLTGEDSYIPLGEASNLVLPGVKDIVREVLTLVGKKT